jgi:two-component system sensor histidine kinase KdpD
MSGSEAGGEPQLLTEPPPRAPGYPLPILAVAIGTVALYAVRPHLERAEAALVYLLVVVFSATLAGVGPAIVAAVLSFFAWNYFLLGPELSLSVEQPRDWFTLGVFLIVGVLTGELAGRARDRAAEAEARLRDVSMLHRMGAAVAEEVDTQKVLLTLVQQASMLCGGARAALLRGGEGGEVAICASDGALRPLPNTGRESGSSLGTVPAGGTLFPLEVDGRRLGALWLGSPPGGVTPHDRRLLSTLASYAGIALERQRLAEEAAAVAQLRAADEMKTSLLAAVSHDLKSPLASIMASISNLRRRAGASSRTESDETLAAVEEETQRLSGLVSDLLDLSRLEAGAWQPAREWYDLGDILGTVLVRFPEEVADRIRLQLPEELPMARVDGVQVAQILWNLLNNACKYSPVHAPVEVTAAAAGGELRVAVTDHGPGVPPAEQEQIFRRFYRSGDVARGSVPGTGLGLAICHGLVEAHGGRLWVESDGRSGATFVFTLPVDPEETVTP